MDWILNWQGINIDSYFVDSFLSFLFVSFLMWELLTFEYLGPRGRPCHFRDPCGSNATFSLSQNNSDIVLYYIIVEKINCSCWLIFVFAHCCCFPFGDLRNDGQRQQWEWQGEGKSSLVRVIRGIGSDSPGFACVIASQFLLLFFCWSASTSGSSRSFL